ncbi:hypothetical protein [Novosphingobium humi]|uniref:Uncharacterized protein n=1 Tax=Novosphingobium humi TaxID=2282397 RepID=A0ABY7TYZ2_9SPHN|nr:hypothetical protein [Novosphingobium humi]WCT77756.1 hypothetical protein PQ457_01900 [Novosphingobium humi]
MAMRSAIHYPDTHLQSPQAMASALLLWDKLRVIVPFEDYPIRYRNTDMNDAWELIGKPLVPDDANKRQAHESIKAMLEAGVPRQIQYRDDLQPGQEYEIWPQKLNYETWEMLQQSRMTAAPLANGDYPFEQEAGITIMAKLADACAGTTFARVTDKMLAYGLIGDRDEPVLAQSHVVPLTLELIDANAISLEKLIDFRRREEREQKGGDYKAWRHTYADSVQSHIARLRQVQSANERDQINEEFRDEMDLHLRELKRAVGIARTELVLKPVVVSAAVGVGFLAGGSLGGLAAGLTGLAVEPTLKFLTDMFSAGIGFSEKQRKAMEKNPMAYMYQLSRA